MIDLNRPRFVLFLLTFQQLQKLEFHEDSKAERQY